MTKEQMQDARQRVKDHLNQYRQLVAEKLQIQQEMQRIEMETTAASAPNMDGMPRGSGVSDPTAARAFARIRIRERYEAQLAELDRAQLELEHLIGSLDPVERRVMRYRYMQGLQWEAVCAAMNYSWRQTHKIHARALDKLVDVLQA